MSNARPRARKSTHENPKTNISSATATTDADGEVLGLEEELEEAEGGIRKILYHYGPIRY